MGSAGNRDSCAGCYRANLVLVPPVLIFVALYFFMSRLPSCVACLACLACLLFVGISSRLRTRRRIPLPEGIAVSEAVDRLRLLANGFNQALASSLCLPSWRPIGHLGSTMSCPTSSTHMAQCSMPDSCLCIPAQARMCAAQAAAEDTEAR